MLGIDIMLLADQLEYHRIVFFHTKLVGSDQFLWSIVNIHFNFHILYM